MSNFSQNNYETPTTGVKLRWGSPDPEWNDDLKGLFKAFKDNEYSKFFYQTDVFQIRLALSRYHAALHNPDMTASGWKALDDQLDKFGTNMKSRANIRYTQAKTEAAEDYSATLPQILQDAFEGDDS